MQRKLALTAVLAVAFALGGYAQRQDFSGTWAVDQVATDAVAANTATPPAGGRGGGGGMGLGGVTIKQTSDSITLVRQGQSGPVTATYKLDGVEQTMPLGELTVKAKAKWDGDKIVIETTRSGQDGSPFTSWLTLQLDDKGTLWTEQKGPNGITKRAFKKTA